MNTAGEVQERHVRSVSHLSPRATGDLHSDATQTHLPCARAVGLYRRPTAADARRLSVFDSET